MQEGVPNNTNIQPINIPNVVPFHIHNGVDAPQINSNNIIGSVGESFTDNNGTDHSTSATTTWENWDISADITSTATTAEIYIKNNFGSAQSLGVRNTGSSANRLFTVGANSGSITSLVKVIGGIVQIYASNSNLNTFRVIGYWD